jgi:molybdopterin molybdotransferase
MAYLNVTKIEEALSQMKLRFQRKDSTVEMVDLEASLGRYLAKDLYATENLPSFRRSMVDGYAVLASDTLGASEQSPMILQVVGSVDIGCKSELNLTTGYAAYVPTGGEIPVEAEAMVMIEHTEALGPDIAIYYTATYGENIVGIGEDVQERTLILKKGTRLAPQHEAILASLGYAEIPVVKKPKVFILSTGDELVDVSSTPGYGQVRDCNSTIIRNIVESCGCEVVDSVRVIDEIEAFQKALRNATVSADVVILSGGSSAGIKDMTQLAIDSLAGNTDSPNVFIHGLAIKPGKPTVVGQIGEKPVIGLPGHPAACFITMKAFVEPFLNDFIGKKETEIRRIPCISGFQLHAAGGRDVYQLVEMVYEEEKLTAHILYGKSGMVSALAKANAYVVIKMNQEGIKVGDNLVAYLL